MTILKQGKRFVFTLHKEDEVDLDDFKIVFMNTIFGIYGGCQLEQCPDTLRYHIQGWCVFKTNQRPESLKELNRRIHWENMRGSVDDSIEYCSKSDSRVMPYRSWGEIPKNCKGKRTDLDDAVDYIKSLDGSAAYRMRMLANEHPSVYVKYFKGFWDICRQLEVQTPLPALPWHPWQQRVLSSCLVEASRRKIHWIHDSVGNRGKSYLSSYLVTNTQYNAIELCGKVADMAYAYNGERVVIFDIVRSQAEHIDHLYDFAERLKNGRIFSGKYESRTKIFNPPHVFFFANFPPDYTKWSQDRYDVINLDGEFTPITIPVDNDDQIIEAPTIPRLVRGIEEASADNPVFPPREGLVDTQASTVLYTPASTQLLMNDIEANLASIFDNTHVIDLTFLD